MTPTQLETELREALQTSATRLSPDAGARLRRIDYHPRQRRVRPQVAIAAVAGAAAAGAVAAVSGLGVGTPNAFAGWTATPTPASATQIRAAEAACRARLARSPVPAGLKGQVLGASRLPAQLTDTRGPFTFTIFAHAGNSASCITGPGFVSISGTYFKGASAATADEMLLSVSHTSRDDHPYTFAEGHTGSNVRAATLALTDGRSVRATIAHGWFVAWWPGASNVTRIRMRTASGVRTQRFSAVPLPPRHDGQGGYSKETLSIGGFAKRGRSVGRTEMFSGGGQ